MVWDLVVAGATVFDGSGAPGRPTDVAVADGRIAAIGQGLGAATEIVDGRGRALSPGFIDTHSHDDLALIRDPDMGCKVSQGVTTVINGNCGISVAPVTIESPLPPPFPLLGSTEEFRFPTVESYRRHLAESPAAINSALLVGHSTIRYGVMGGDTDRAATPDEIAAMTHLVDRQLAAGCAGLSSGLDYPPALPASRDELVALAHRMQATPGAVYASHIRDEADGVLAAVDEAIDVATRAEVPLVISHHKVAGPRNYGRSVETLARIDDAIASGVAVSFDVYPYTASSTQLLPRFIHDAELVVVMWSDAHPECAGRGLTDIAAEWGCRIDEAVRRLSPAGAIYHQMDEGDLERILGHEVAMVGSDGIPGRGNPHPRLWGTFPRVLGRYVRERSLLSLAEAIHRMTGRPADVFGLADRGRIAVGTAADLVLFDPSTVADTATYNDPERAATGIEHVWVNGARVWDGTASTGVRPGQFLVNGSE